MISAYLQIMAGAIALLPCVWSFIQAVKMDMANRRQGLNGSNGMTVRTIKRREIIHIIKCLIVLGTGVYVAMWLKLGGGDTESLMNVRTQGFMAIALLIGLNALWDVMDRLNIIEAKAREDAQLLLQKRQSDPTPGADLPPIERERVQSKPINQKIS